MGRIKSAGSQLMRWSVTEASGGTGTHVIKTLEEMEEG